MAAELGKLAEIVRSTSLAPRDSVHTLISSQSTYLLERKMIPHSLREVEGRIGQPEEADTLTNIAERLDATNYQKGAIFIRHLNAALNESGMLTDKNQERVIFEAKKPYSTSKVSQEMQPQFPPFE